MLAADITQAVLTAALTLIGASVLLLATEGVMKPYMTYRHVLSDITRTLVYRYGIVISAPAGSKPDEHAAISEELRKLAAQLRSSITALPSRTLLRVLRLVPSQRAIEDAAGRLTRISNRLLETKDKKHEEIFGDIAAIGELLHIDTPR